MIMMTYLRIEGKGPSEGRGGWRICGNQEGDDLRVVYDGMMH